MNKRTCLITGGAGFIGSHIAHALLGEGWEVRVLERRHGNRVFQNEASGHLRVFEGDFSDIGLATRALEGVDTLYHYASTTLPATAYGHSVQDVTSNLVGTLALLDTAVTQGCQRVVFPSSGGTIYGVLNQCPIPESHLTKPICSHGIVKLAIENYLHLMSLERNLQYTILRYANPYGPRQRSNSAQGAVAVFASKILNLSPIEIWGDGKVVRDFVYIDDVVRATIQAATFTAGINQIFNVGCGVGVSLIDLIAKIEELTGLKATIRFGPARPFDVPVNILSIEKAKAHLGWEPLASLQDGLLKTIEAISSQSQK